MAVSQEYPSHGSPNAPISALKECRVAEIYADPWVAPAELSKMLSFEFSFLQARSEEMQA